MVGHLKSNCVVLITTRGILSTCCESKKFVLHESKMTCIHVFIEIKRKVNNLC